MIDESNIVKFVAVPKGEAILKACRHFATFQCLVAEHRLTGRDMAEGMALISVNEQLLKAGGARV